MNTIGNRLKAERLRLGLSQADFGAFGGVKKGAQINYEKDDRQPSAVYLQSLSDHGVDVNYVITGRTAGQEERYWIDQKKKMQGDIDYYVEALRKVRIDLGVNDGHSSGLVALSADELKIINTYRSASDEERKAIATVLDAFKKEE